MFLPFSTCTCVNSNLSLLAIFSPLAITSPASAAKYLINPLVSTPDYVFHCIFAGKLASLDPSDPVLRNEVLVRAFPDPIADRHLLDAVEPLQVADHILGCAQGWVVFDAVQHVLRCP